MPSLLKRSNGIYYIIFEVQGKKKWKSTGETQKSKALDLLMNFDLSTETRQQRRISYLQFVSEYLAYAVATYAPGTTKIYRSAFSLFEKIVGDIPLRAITPQHVDQYKVKRLGEVSPVAVNIELRSLKSAFYTSLRWKLIEENPFKMVSLARVPEQQPIFLKETEFKKLLSIISEEWFRDIVLVAALTGMRRGELLNLEWSEIDFERKLILIQSKSTFKTKTRRRRTIPMNDTVFNVLRGRSVREDRCSYIFSLKGKRITGGYLSHTFKRYIREAGLNVKLHFHSLRHTFATWLVQRSVSIYEVQKLLGHSSITMTQVYSHLVTEELHSAVEKISLPTF
jgi:integrase